MVLMGRPLRATEEEEIDRRLDRAGQILAIFGAVVVAFAYMLMRRIAGRMYLLLPPFYLTVTSNLLVMPFALWIYSTQGSPTVYTWQCALNIVGVAVATLAG